MKQEQKPHSNVLHPWRDALRAAFPHTIPILAGFLFLGISYGIYMHTLGFAFWYPMLMSLLIFAGSVEFIAANLLLGPFQPLHALALTLILNARHLFYGIAMLSRYRNTGKKKLYLIFGLCDESFSINYTATPPEGIDRGKFMSCITLLNHLYWFSGATIGGIFGSLLTFNTEGLAFVMTAMFVVILIEQWKKDHCHIGEWCGLIITAAALLLFGADQFMLPAMAMILVVLLLFRRPAQRQMASAHPAKTDTAAASPELFTKNDIQQEEHRP